MQTDYPQKPGINFFLKQAFFYWNRTILYQLIFSVIYFSIFIFVSVYFLNYFGLMEKYTLIFQQHSEDFVKYQSEVQKLYMTPEFQNVFWVIIALKVFLYPLNLGFFKIFRKLDSNEKIEIKDLFSGYEGINFFLYTSFYLFWFFIYYYSISTFFLGIIWVVITLFCAPLMFFMNKSIFSGIKLSVKAFRMYPVEILVCIFVAILYKYVGFLTFFGAFFTYPFWNSMIYALYKTVFSEVAKN